jgi:hypothetical protein
MIAESPPPVARSSSPSTTISNGQLGVEQLVTLQTLYNLNMPATEIAGVMERMRAGQEASEAGSMSGLIGPHAPPGYDLPTVVIADETERAQREPHASGEGSSELIRSNITQDPPRYDFKDN